MPAAVVDRSVPNVYFGPDNGRRRRRRRRREGRRCRKSKTLCFPRQ